MSSPSISKRLRGYLFGGDELSDEESGVLVQDAEALERDVQGFRDLAHNNAENARRQEARAIAAEGRVAEAERIARELCGGVDCDNEFTADENLCLGCKVWELKKVLGVV